MEETAPVQTAGKDEHHPKRDWYDRYYKLLLVLPVVLFIGCLVYLGVFYSQQGDFFIKDSSLAGGTSITINGDIDPTDLESALKQSFDDIYVRTISDVRSGDILAVIVESSATPEQLKPADRKSTRLNSSHSSISYA